MYLWEPGSVTIRAGEVLIPRREGQVKQGIVTSARRFAERKIKHARDFGRALLTGQYWEEAASDSLAVWGERMRALREWGLNLPSSKGYRGVKKDELVPHILSNGGRVLGVVEKLTVNKLGRVHARVVHGFAGNMALREKVSAARIAFRRKLEEEALEALQKRTEQAEIKRQEMEAARERVRIIRARHSQKRNPMHVQRDLMRATAEKQQPKRLGVRVRRPTRRGS